jgi:chemotaxis protein methyltransferase CheR
MEDSECIRFLQQVLPQLRMRWPGFRRVRKQVCKRIQRRITGLGLEDTIAYHDFLQSHGEEWRTLDHCCRVTVSRFYRDISVLKRLGSEVLPWLAASAIDAGENSLYAWSAGCAMGEEAYSLILIWDQAAGRDYPQVDISILGSDIDDRVLQKAVSACYSESSLKALPGAWLRSAFSRRNSTWCLEPRLRSKARFVKQDIRDNAVEGPFHIVFCRNLAFTYFEHALQLEVLARIHEVLLDDGILVIGSHESLPEGYDGFEPWPGSRAIFRKVTGASDG